MGLFCDCQEKQHGGRAGAGKTGPHVARLAANGGNPAKGGPVATTGTVAGMVGIQGTTGVVRPEKYLKGREI